MIPIKPPEEIEIMKEGGRRLALVMKEMIGAVRPGITLSQLDKLADLEIKKQGGTPSFKMVPGYRWAACLNVNQGVVHGIPSSYQLKASDLLSLDVGMFYSGFHTDMATTVAVSGKREKFLKAGEKALEEAIKMAKGGNFVAHISKAIEKTIKKAGFSPVEALTGHGVGKKLHEEPAIPCFWQENIKDSPRLSSGMVLAIEVIYAQGQPDVVLGNDGWTVETADGKLAGLFEQTVAIAPKSPIILTA